MWLGADDDVAHRHSLDAVLRCGLRRVRLDEPFLFVRTNRNDDFVRRKRRKSVANGETDIRLTSRSIDGLARQLLGRAFGDPRRMTERFLVVGEPVERALPYNRHHDLDGFGVPNMPAQNVVGMFDGADDEYVPAHAWKRTAEDSPPHRGRKTAGDSGKRRWLRHRSRPSSRRWLRLSSVSGLASSSTTGSARSKGEGTEGVPGLSPAGQPRSLLEPSRPLNFQRKRWVGHPGVDSRGLFGLHS